MLPFYDAVRRQLGPMPWADLVGRQLLAAIAMAAVAWLLRAHPWPAAAVSLLVYGGVLAALRTGRDPDLQRVLQVLPRGRKSAAQETPHGAA